MAARKTLATSMKNIVAEARKNTSFDYRPLVDILSRTPPGGRPLTPAQQRAVQQARAALNALARRKPAAATRALHRSWPIGR